MFLASWLALALPHGAQAASTGETSAEGNSSSTGSSETTGSPAGTGGAEPSGDTQTNSPSPATGASPGAGSGPAVDEAEPAPGSDETEAEPDDTAGPSEPAPEDEEPAVPSPSQPVNEPLVQTVPPTETVPVEVAPVTRVPSPLEAKEAGQALPLDSLLPEVRSEGSEVIDAQLFEAQGYLVYELKVITPEGRVTNQYFNARSGEQLQVR